MKKELRGDERYNEIGRVECEQIGALPGVLNDISKSGCKICFPFIASIDKEKEYIIFIQLSRTDFSEKFQLICSPQWIIEKDCQTEIGFSFLRSPDSPKLVKYIENLKDKENSDDITSLIIEDDTDFI